MRKLMALILMILIVLPVRVLAQIKTGNPPIPVVPHFPRKKRKTPVSAPSYAPIDVKAESYQYYDADNGWTEATTTSFSYKGSLLTQPKDFERVITPLNDLAANNLLRSAADKDGWGQGLLWGGAAVEAAGWTDFTLEMLNMETTDSSGHITDHVPNMAPATLMILGGVGLVVKGLFNQIDANGDRASAVDRYNSVIKPNQNLSMMVLPNTQAVGLGFTQAF
jgi:hypothetical protein